MRSNKIPSPDTGSILRCRRSACLGVDFHGTHGRSQATWMIADFASMNLLPYVLPTCLALIERNQFFSFLEYLYDDHEASVDGKLCNYPVVSGLRPDSTRRLKLRTTVYQGARAVAASSLEDTKLQRRQPKSRNPVPIPENPNPESSPNPESLNPESKL